MTQVETHRITCARIMRKFRNTIRPGRRTVTRPIR